MTVLYLNECNRQIIFTGAIVVTEETENKTNDVSVTAASSVVTEQSIPAAITENTPFARSYAKVETAIANLAEANTAAQSQGATDTILLRQARENLNTSVEALCITANREFYETPKNIFVRFARKMLGGKDRSAYISQRLASLGVRLDNVEGAKAQAKAIHAVAGRFTAKMTDKQQTPFDVMIIKADEAIDLIVRADKQLSDVTPTVLTAEKQPTETIDESLKTADPSADDKVVVLKTRKRKKPAAEALKDQQALEVQQAREEKALRELRDAAVVKARNARASLGPVIDELRVVANNNVPEGLYTPILTRVMGNGRLTYMSERLMALSLRLLEIGEGKKATAISELAGRLEIGPKRRFLGPTLG